MAWTAVAGSVVGGLLGGGSGGSSQTTKNEIDPRMAAMLYGADGKSGLLGDVNAWYGANKSGMNQNMVDGLNQMNNVYRSPLATQGYQTMAQTGNDLMGRGVAGNPFTDGRRTLGQGTTQPMQQQANPWAGLVGAQTMASPAAQPTTQAATQPAAQAPQGLLSLNNGFSSAPGQAFTMAQPAAVPIQTAQPTAAQDPAQMTEAEKVAAWQKGNGKLAFDSFGW